MTRFIKVNLGGKMEHEFFYPADRFLEKGEV
jgi:hypothetical protein